MTNDRTCRTCAWHEDFNAVCFNGDSPYAADYTDNAQKCSAWEQKAQNRQKEPQKAQKSRKPLTAEG